MALSIDWPTKVITVPKADTTLIQATPTEVRELELNTFRLNLKVIESSEEGMAYIDTHQHSPPVDVGGVTLARVVEIINGYTITFEDGQYAVNLIGANSNVGDVVNVNQVSIRTGNSAGLVTSAAIEYGEYGGGVTIDTVNGEAGTIYPVGTLRRPVNNILDAALIATTRGFSHIDVIGNLTLTAGDNITNMSIHGQSAALTSLVVESAAVTDSCTIQDVQLSGVLDGNTIIERSIINALSFVNGVVFNSMINGPITLGGGVAAHILDCKSGVPGAGTPVINMGGSGQGLALRGYSGGIELQNKTGTDAVSLDIDQGQAILASSVTNGQIVVRGNTKLTDNSVGATVIDETMTVEALWAYQR